jgi:tRNA(His) 5'-end guanylyltransferase
MRALEVFHSLRLLPGAWVILRLDGRGFSRFTEARFEKPFDVRFHELMMQTAHWSSIASSSTAVSSWAMN